VNSQAQTTRRSMNCAIVAAITAVLLATHFFGSHLLVTTVAAILCVYIFQLVNFTGERANSVSAAIGSLTYSSYLLHFPLQLLIVTLCLTAGWNVPLYDPRFFLFYVALVFGLAFLCYRLFELPMQNGIRRKFPLRAERREITPQAAAVPGQVI
jgi:peptidoglycan/LPS O-acetylase OafA/YrhL